MIKESYLFEHAWEQERRRLDLLEQIFDPPTLEFLGRLPVAAGAHCLEVGAGAGSVARWLCDRAGPDGRVVATDLDTGFLEELTEKNLEVRRHDIRTDELEEGAFDLIHSRLVLFHLAEREQVIGRLASALRPGGWLVLEDFDWTSLIAAPGCSRGELATRLHQALPQVFPPGAAEFGRILPLAFRHAGLVDVGAEGRVQVGLGGSRAAAWWQLSMAALRQPLLEAGLLSEAELSEALRACDDDGYCILFPTMITAWGRRPPA